MEMGLNHVPPTVLVLDVHFPMDNELPACYVPRIVGEQHIDDSVTYHGGCN